MAITVTEQRVKEELTALEAKSSKLVDFFGTELFAQMPRDHATLLILQHSVMSTYALILRKRLQLFEGAQSN
jgi:hypothetical protein